MAETEGKKRREAGTGEVRVLTNKKIREKRMTRGTKRTDSMMAKKNPQKKKRTGATDPRGPRLRDSKPLGKVDDGG